MNASASIVVESDGNNPILGFFRSNDAREIIAAAFARPGLGEVALSEGGIDVAVKVMRRGEKPSLVLFDISLSSNPAGDIATIVKHGGRALPVIAIGEAIDVAKFRDLIAAGIFDYIDWASGAQQLADAVTRARRQRARRATDAGPARQGRLVVFCGTRGGLGTTSTAIGTAWVLAHDRETSTALVDLDLSSGTVAFALDIDPGRGLREGLDQPSRIDAVFIERCIVRESVKLGVLSAEEPYNAASEIDPAAALVLLDELRQTFDCVVVDLPRAVTPLSRVVLGAADDIVFLYGSTLTGLRDALRWTEFAAAIADRAVIRLVRGPEPGAAHLEKSDFEKSLGRKIDMELQFDAKAAAAAANAGKAIPAVAPDSSAAKSFDKLATLLGFEAREPELRAGFRWPWQKHDA